MPSIVGTWKLLHATARDAAGALRPSPYGGKGVRARHESAWSSCLPLEKTVSSWRVFGESGSGLGDVDKAILLRGSPLTGK